MADETNLPSADEQKAIDDAATADTIARGGTPTRGGAAPTPATEAYGDGTPSFAGFPQTKWHPVYGARSVKDPNEAATVFQPPHNWFATPEQADAARTDREAQQVVHHNLATKVAQKNATLNGEELPGDRKEIVRNSATAQANLDAGRAEPL